MPAPKIPKNDTEHGEGNYSASRRYDAEAKRFAESGKVEQAARDAAPKSPAEAAELLAAEQAAAGRARSKAPAAKANVRATGSKRKPPR